MSRLKRFSLTLGLAAVLYTLIGCGEPLKPMQMNNRMAKANDRMATAAKKFYKAIEPLSQGRPPDNSLSSVYSEVGTALQSAKKDFTNVLPPHGSGPGAELLDRYLYVLQQQQVIYDKCITPMYNAAQNNSLDPIARWRVIFPLLSQARSEESLAMEPFTRAHQEYCKHHLLDPK